MFTSFSGKSVVVTGGTRGIGKGIAKVFAILGANVTIVGRKESDGSKSLAELESLISGGSVAYISGDVSKEKDCVEIMDFAAQRFSGVDILCANAGIFPEKALSEMTAFDLDETFDTNLKGTIFCAKAALEYLKTSGRGRIIITSSITGPMTGFPKWSHYGASKAAQLGFMRSAAIELAPFKITVNAVLPGNILTEGLNALGEDYLNGMRSSIPYGDLGTVEDIGYACAFLASEEAKYITGHSLVVDGGQTLPESQLALDALRS